MEELLPMVYKELHRLAEQRLSRERRDHTLQATALVNEAYLRLVDQRNPSWENRAHFLGVAATMMRRILMNHAQARRAAKRGGASCGANRPVGSEFRPPAHGRTWLCRTEEPHESRMCHRMSARASGLRVGIWIRWATEPRRAIHP